MPEKQLLIKINAEDKYCGDCTHRKVNLCFQFPSKKFPHCTELELNNGIGVFRCRACLDAEKKAKERCFPEQGTPIPCKDLSSEIKINDGLDE